MLMLAAAGTALQAYVIWRISSIPSVQRHLPWPALAVIGIVLWVVLILSFTVGHGGTGWFSRLLEFVGMTWLGILFLTFTVLLAADLLTGFGLLLPKVAPPLRGVALLCAGVLSAIALVQGMRPPVVRNSEVRLRGLPASLDGTVLVAISDLHLGSMLGERWLGARVAQIDALRPDMIVLLGDIVEGHRTPEQGLLQGLRRLSAPLGVWAVTGNHETYGDHEGNARILEEAGIRVLHDRWEIVRPGLILAGVDDLTARHRSGQGDDALSRALADRPPGATILLSHTPWRALEAAAAGAGLMLCGHTHGGQIWPFDSVTRTLYPLIGGTSSVAGMPVIVCRGTGTWGPRMRLWRPSEILRITLRAGPRSNAMAE